jgi:DNA-binding GntR family transcriptional regulator
LSKAQSLSELMFLEIRFGILSARYLPGQVIAKADVAEVYASRPVAVAEVLGALAHEGYLNRQGRSEFVVRTWGHEEVEDLFEMRANFEGLAAFRAAERATAAEISLLAALAAEAHEPSPGDPEALERVVLENLRFHIEVMRMSRIPQIPDMARMVLPNALHRRIAWSQRADDAEESFRMHQKIASAIGDRSASMARLLMREDIYSSRESVLAAIEALAGHEAADVATIVRFAPTFELDGRIYGQGTREAGADGRVIPFGVPAGNLK